MRYSSASASLSVLAWPDKVEIREERAETLPPNILDGPGVRVKVGSLDVVDEMGRDKAGAGRGWEDAARDDAGLRAPLLPSLPPAPPKRASRLAAASRL